MMTSRRPAGVTAAHPRRWIAAVLALATAGGLATAATTAAGAAPTNPRPGAAKPAASATANAVINPFGQHGAVQWARIEPACATPKDPQAIRCDALERVDVPAGTPGARAYIRPSGLTAGPAGGYTPADLAFFYGFKPNTPRSKQTIALVDWFNDPKVRADLNTFDKHYKLKKETARSFRVVNQNGKAKPLPKKNSSTSEEISLDVQSARAVCHTCKIVLIEAKGPQDLPLATAQNTAVRLGATEISDSYGEPEHKLPAKIRNAYNHPGVVTTVSTGDDGWFGWDFANQTNGVSDSSPQFPATSPFVVSVGGTTLGVDSKGRRAELVWNENGPEDTWPDGNPHFGDTPTTNATGSGCSRLYPAQPWQRNFPNYAKAGCHGKRLAADVSAIADPFFGFDIFDSFGNGGWTTIGGTSLASPVTAAMFALAGGARGAEYAAASLYVNTRVHPASRYDIWKNPAFPGWATGNGFCSISSATQCGNDLFTATGTTHNPNDLGAGLVDCSFSRNVNSTANATTTSTECNVAKGLDGPTGLGAPKSLRFYTATNPRVRIMLPHRAVRGRHQVYGLKATELVGHAKITKRVWIWGNGTRTVAHGPKVRHTYRRAGRFRITLLVTDSRFQTTILHKTVIVRK